MSRGKERNRKKNKKKLKSIFKGLAEAGWIDLFLHSWGVSSFNCGTKETKKKFTQKKNGGSQCNCIKLNVLIMT